MNWEDVIIIGGGNHHNTLGVVRALGERNISFELITFGSETKHYVSSSKYVSKHIAFIDPNHIIKYLLERKCNDNKGIIISCADVITEILNLNHSLLFGKYIMPGFKKSELVQSLMDKSTMINIAKKCGIDSPKVWTLPTDFAIVKYPCITKSNLSSHGGKETVVIFESREQLEKFIKKQQASAIFAQEYIQKKEEVQFIGLSINGGDEVIIPGMTKIIRSQPNTNTGFLEYGTIVPFYKDFVDKTKMFIKNCEYSGLFSIEFIRDYSDNVYFLEVNFRNDGNAWCVTKAGINLPIIWLKASIGEDYRDEIIEPKHILMMPEFQDFKMVLQRKLSLHKWIKDWLLTDYFMEYDSQDKKPFFQYIIDKIR